MQERGLVYCESGQCILVPTVCRNVSRIARSAVDSDRATAPEVAPADVAAAPVADPLDPAEALLPDAPGTPPLALDSAPSFQAPEDWRGPVAFGGGGSYVADPVAGDPGAGSHGGAGPNVSTASVPPFGSDSAAAPLAAAAVPEPQTWALLLVGLAALAWVQRRRVRAC